MSEDPRGSAVPRPVKREPSMLFRILRPNSAVILLGLVFGLAVVELLASFLAYDESIDDADWRGVDAKLTGHEDEPLLVASDWLGARARMELPHARSPAMIGAPDLRGEARFWLLTHARERPWGEGLRAELEDLPEPELVAVHSFGELVLREYVLADAASERLSMLDALAEAEVSSDAGACRGTGDAWRCKEGRLSRRLVEIDYHPRDCLAVELGGGAQARVDLGRVELGDRLRGHVGFGDFNARLRSDPVGMVEVWIDGAAAARWLFTDDQGWAAFALETPPGEHALELRLSTSVLGTWQAAGYEGQPNDVFCVEARSLLEEAEPS
ncbi:hypothetical protein G6O69_04090 [Pseudenhygromyxa sp. WMMC2535]|uniref:hypothetical protein n=1 Tax=Pseudenhygromyxa sp. WMMC2535 TaxID=2712867 RepID=UPI001552E745|nr:hypothetical protein [Pseudenhygromyxa sp. WMMC2535]NVB36997.1 hypothetical protein [Pseudenhygromyxa sp. WMMC2535]